jgi:hypothetical protein
MHYFSEKMYKNLTFDVILKAATSKTSRKEQKQALMHRKAECYLIL